MPNNHKERLLYPDKYPFINEFGFLTTKKSLNEMVLLAKQYCKKYFRFQDSKYYGLEIAMAILKTIHQFDPGQGDLKWYLYYKLKREISYNYLKKDKVYHDNVLVLNPDSHVFEGKKLQKAIELWNPDVLS